MALRLKGSTSGSVELDVPAAVSGGDVTLTLPNGTGSANQFLKNGSAAGTLEYSSIVETSAGNIQVTGTRGGSLQPSDNDSLELYTSATSGSANTGSGLTFYNHDSSGFEMGGTIQVAKDNGTADNTSSYMRFSTRSNGSSAAERMRLDSSGRLLVGKSSSSKNARIVAQGNSDNSSSSAEVYLQRGEATPPDATDLASIHFADNTGTTGAVIRGRRDGGTWSGSSKPSSLLFSTCADGGTALATRMLIKNTGLITTFSSTANGALNVLTAQGASTSANLILGQHSASNIGGGTLSFLVFSNGNVQNSNNSYGQISDQKLKENIVDANSQWDNIKGVRVRNFNFIEGQTHTQIGVVAQELEAVSPGLIDEAPDRDEDGNDLGTVTKSVKYSVLYMKAVKALQEAMDRIETLEARVTTLEAS
ncbi:endosialidase [uncultured Mediterranean phage uvMED]|nr:endosialidase [uncultured Mediterranean phage uvMED]